MMEEPWKNQTVKGLDFLRDEDYLNIFRWWFHFSLFCMFTRMLGNATTIFEYYICFSNGKNPPPWVFILLRNMTTDDHHLEIKQSRPPGLELISPGKALRLGSVEAGQMD